MTSDTITHQREAAFHDAWAGSTPIDDVLVRECFEAPTAMENRFILSRMGDLKGKRLLDIGAGLGESSVYFALQGAHVTMTDISPGMVQTGRELARKYGVEIEGIVSQAEDLGVSAETYDFVYIANTIHHVRDRDALFQKIHRALKPGGRFFSYDPVAYNPAINVYRRMATEVRTEDESPLTLADLKLAQEVFPQRAASRILDFDSAAFREVLRGGPRASQSGPLLEKNPARDTPESALVDAVARARCRAHSFAAGALAGVEHGDVGRKGSVTG